MASFTHYRVSNYLQAPIFGGENLPSSNQSSSSSSSSAKPFLTSFADNLNIKIISLTDTEIVFDLIGVDASIANSLRRIFLAEVPTVAIESVFIEDNTSVIQDEVLSHRLGLIPLMVDPNLLQYTVGDEETTEDTLVYRLDVECYPPTSEGDKVINQKVYSDQLVWVPQGNQSDVISNGNPVHSDILIAEMRPGQRIVVEAHANKGIGKDHTKFSPVATASYRLLPDITFTHPVTGDLATQLKAMCPMQVFDIEDIKSVPTAIVARPRDCTMCRECIRREGWEEGRVELKRKANHFIFSVETVGTLRPEVIVREGISVLKKKAVKFHKYTEEYEARL